MPCTKLLAAGFVFVAVSGLRAQSSSYPNIGRTPTKEEIQAVDIAGGGGGGGGAAAGGSGATKRVELNRCRSNPCEK